MTHSLAQTFEVRRRCMIHAPIIPDGHVVCILPTVANLHIVVPNDQIEKPLHQLAGLERGQIIDLLGVVSEGKDRLPTRDWVGSYHRVNGAQFLADVLGTATGCAVDLEVGLLSSNAELGLCICCSQAVEKLLIRSRKTVVELISRGP